MNARGGSSVLLGALALFALIICAVLLLGEFSKAQDAVAQRQYAQAALVVAQGQARLDSALAFQIISSSLFPWLVVLVAAILAAIIIFLSYQSFIRSKPSVILISAPASRPVDRLFVDDSPIQAIVEPADIPLLTTRRLEDAEIRRYTS